MTCRYCGKEVRTVCFVLHSPYGEKCNSSPSGKHIAISDGKHCVYCGEEVKHDGIDLRSSRNNKCNASPNSKHALDK